MTTAVETGDKNIVVEELLGTVTAAAGIGAALGLTTAVETGDKNIVVEEVLGTVTAAAGIGTEL